MYIAIFLNQLLFDLGVQTLSQANCVVKQIILFLEDDSLNCDNTFLVALCYAAFLDALNEIQKMHIYNKRLVSFT
jgi:hypothetical protein